MTPSKHASSRTHLTTIDALRGFAALAVFLFHLTGGILFEPMRHALRWGYAGVDVFFVISGFIVPYVLRRSGYRTGGALSFMAKRLLRLGPPSWIAILLAVALYPFGPSSDLAAWTANLTLRTIAANMFYVIPFTGGRWLNGVFWTLAIEWQFYLIVALTFGFVFRSGWTLFVGATVLLLLNCVPDIGRLEFVRYSQLFIMGGTALLYKERRVNLATFVLALVLLSVVTFWLVGHVQAVFGVTTALAIAFSRIENRVALFFGQISYPLYLVHSPVATAVTFALVLMLPPETMTIRIAEQLICVVAVLSFAYLFYLVVEAPFVRLANRSFSKRLVSRNSHSHQAPTGSHP